MTTALAQISIAFDLDGTLVDTAPDLVRVLNDVVVPEGLSPAPLETARNLIGYGSLAMIKNAYERTNTPLDEDKALALQDTFLKLYAQTLSQLSKPYPGVMETLSVLKRAGARLSVCTNKPGAMARPLLADLGMAHFFERIIGSEDAPARKPSAQHIFCAVGHRGHTPIIMVGDGLPDVLAAKAAKCPVILMDYGYSRINVHSLGADKVLKSFRELPKILEQFTQNSYIA
jgi:phosphoglycolate phosphatase